MESQQGSMQQQQEMPPPPPIPSTIKPESLLPPPHVASLDVPPASAISAAGSIANAPAAAPVAAPFDGYINLRVADANGEVFFKVKKTTPFKKVFDAYQQRQGLPNGSVRYLYDGERLDETHTPLQKDMRDNDLIDAMVMQTGGQHSSSSSSMLLL